MNYRHIYHAGNFADVFKHLVLLRVLSYLRQKDKPFFALDTHAGTGLYKLDAQEALKTAEAQDGIIKLWNMPDPPAAIAEYCAMVKKFNPGLAAGAAPFIYPGSPMIIKDRLRKSDRLVACELHPQDAQSLCRVLGQDRRVRVEGMDGYTALRALCPPAERRGMVLVDPPFEVGNEFALMVRGLREAHTRWATGIFAFWYPIKDPAAITRYHRDIHALGIARCLALDFMLRPANDTARLNGCGMVVVNPPHILAEEMRAIGPFLTRCLAEPGGLLRVHQITGEKTS